MWCVGWVHFVHICSNVLSDVGVWQLVSERAPTSPTPNDINTWGMSVVGWPTSVRAACRTRKLLLKRQQSHKETRGTSKCRRRLFLFRLSACQLLQVICVVQKSQTTTWDGAKNPVNNEIFTYIYHIFTISTGAGFQNHQQYVSMCCRQKKSKWTCPLLRLKVMVSDLCFLAFNTF